jgi:hypothetical protein
MYRAGDTGVQTMQPRHQGHWLHCAHAAAWLLVPIRGDSTALPTEQALQEAAPCACLQPAAIAISL